MDGRLSRGMLWRVVCLAFALPGLAKADAINSEWSSTTRARSMGDIGIASADDPDISPFFNPAALARIKKPTLEPLNPEIDLGGGLFTDSHSIADWMKVASYSKMIPMLRANPGTPISAGLSVFPNFSAQNFSFGVLLAVDGAAYYDLNKNAFYYHSRKLFVPSLGISAAGLGGRFRIGAAVRGVQISETNIVTPGPGTSSETALTNSRNGFGVALDAGMLLTMPWAGLPTFGLVARNVGGTAFPMAQLVPLGGTTPTRHEVERMTYDAGLSFAPKMAQKSQLTFAVDYRDALNATGVTSQVRHTNLGLEYGIYKTVFFRAGFSQGYWTAGFGLNSKVGSIDLGTFADELSATSYHGIQDRRYSLRLTRRF